MTPDEAREADPARWLERAHGDVRSARVLVDLDPPEVADALFHVQQAIEKAAKALLTVTDTPFRRTHNLAILGGLLRPIEPDLGDLGSEAPLGAQAMLLRYPSVEEEPTADEAVEAVELALTVVATAERWLQRQEDPDPMRPPAS